MAARLVTTSPFSSSSLLGVIKIEAIGPHMSADLRTEPSGAKDELPDPDTTESTTATWQEDVPGGDDEQYEYEDFEDSGVEDFVLHSDDVDEPTILFNIDPLTCPICFSNADSGAALTLPGCNHSFALNVSNDTFKLRLAREKPTFLHVPCQPWGQTCAGR